MKVLLFCLGSLLSLTTFAQNANPDRKRTRHWVFGENNWIEWTDTGALQHPGSKAIQTEQMAVFTDTAGKLQLYFDSKNIYDSEHNVIANGAIPDGFWSAHRGAVFVPYPGSDSLCYLFYTTYSVGRNFAYALVNWKSKMVLKTEVLIKNYVIEGISATIHQNNYFYWISGALQKSDYLFFYLITDKGILPCPFLQPNLNSYKSSSGQCGLSFSLSNKKIVNYDFDINRMQIADFNPFNSKVTNPLIKYTPGGGLQCGAEFSENDRFLYTQIIAFDGFRQHSLSDWSSIVIDSNSIRPVNYSFGLTYLNNAKLVTGFYGTENSKDSNALQLLINTNNLYKHGSFSINWLKAANRLKYAPPNFPYNYHRNYRSDFSYLTNCRSGMLDLSAQTTNEVKTVIWQITSPKQNLFTLLNSNTSMRLTDSGVWTVRMIANYTNGADTVVKKISIFAPFANRILGVDIPVCKDTFTLMLKIPQNSICPRWENLSSENLRSIDTFGTYSVQFYDSNYCYYADTVLVYKADTLPRPKPIITSKDSLFISNYQPSQAWKFVYTNRLVNDTSQSPYYKVNDTGIWKVEVLSQAGCNSAADSLIVSKLKTTPIFNTKIRIYPNPTEGTIHISPNANYDYYISNSLGQSIRSGNGADVNVQDLQSGLYMLQIKSTQNIQQKFKFIKL